MRIVSFLVLLSFLPVPAFATGVAAAPVPTLVTAAPSLSTCSADPVTVLPVPRAVRGLIPAARRESTRLSASFDRRVQELAPATRKPRNWISRHPALFGALVGAAGGALASGTMENELFCSRGDEDCFFHGGSRVLVGAGMGASIGVLIGWLGSL